VSQKLHEDLQREEKAAIDLDIKRGEEEVRSRLSQHNVYILIKLNHHCLQAMKVAIEERRRIKALAEEKRIREAKDEELAKDSILNDIEEQIKFEELCSKDTEVAAKVLN